MEKADPIARSPLYATCELLGAEYVQEAGWLVVRRFDAVEDEVEDARQRVALADVSASGKIVVEGEAATQQLARALDASALAIGQGTVAAACDVFRLRADQYLLRTPPGGEHNLLALLQAAATLEAAGEAPPTATDLTHGRSELLLVGPQSAELLSRLCALDFSTPSFPNMNARQSSVAKTRQLIIRRDRGALPAYALIGARSLAAYLWETIMDSGRDLAIAPIGQQALNLLT